MNNSNQSPFTRDFKRMPEQFIFKMNQMVSNQNANSNSTAIWSKDRKKVIIIGGQPDGSFGIKKYDVAGDILTLTGEVQWI